MRTSATLWLTLVVCLPRLALAQAPAKDVDSFAKQALAALAAKNQQALEAMSIDKAEFQKYIWPTVRVGSGEIGADRFYAQYSKASQIGLTRHLAEHGGKPLELVKASTGPAKQYKGYRVLPDPEVTVRTEGGSQETFKLGSALLEHDGGFKIASYYNRPSPGGATLKQ